MELIFHMDKLLSYLCWKTKNNDSVQILDQSQFLGFALWLRNRQLTGCYSEPIFFDYFVTFSNHSKPYTLLI